MKMVRGVNRYTVEISRTKSPYFERAICFVKPEFAKLDSLDLHRAAARMVCEIDSDIEPQCTHIQSDAHSGKTSFLPFFIGVVLGIAAGVLFSVLFL